MPDTLTLAGHALCPYVQRIAIALAEKGVAHLRNAVAPDDNDRLAAFLRRKDSALSRMMAQSFTTFWQTS